MPLRWDVILWSGLAATAAGGLFFWAARSAALTTVAIPTQVGCLFLRDPRSPATEALGLAILFVLGVVALPPLYFMIMAAGDNFSLTGGLLVGSVQGLLAVLIMPLAGMASACVRAGTLPEPGWFGAGWGKATPVVVWAGHALYGLLLGTLFAGFLRESSAAL